MRKQFSKNKSNEKTTNLELSNRVDPRVGLPCVPNYLRIAKKKKKKDTR